MFSRTLVTSTLLVVVAWAGSADAQSRVEAAPGLVIERIRASRAPTVDAGDRLITIVRVDPERHAFRFITENRDGKRRPLPEWVRSQGLTGAINAGMFLPDGRSVGYLRQKGDVRSDRRPARYDGMIGFDPVGADSLFSIGGAGCPQGFPWLQKRYASVLQGYRMMVDCRGKAVLWPHRRRFSAAGIGVDRDGWVLLVHSRTPYRPRVLNQMLAEPSLGVRGLMYLEGGPEASLVVRSGAQRVREMGSWEDGFYPSDDNREFWALPNIIGFAPRRD